MSEFDDNELDGREARRVAVAEYVLGLGTAQFRAAVASAIQTDPLVAREARLWENRFSHFNDDYEPVAPSPRVWTGIEAALFGSPAAASPARTAWHQSLNFWRGLAGLAAAAAIVAIGLNVLPPAIQEPADTAQLVAALDTVEGDVRFLARYDETSGQLRITGSGSPAGQGNDYELWFIEGENDPISMGVVSLDQPQAVPVAEDLQAQLTQGITLAVTLEVAGGSPTGAPQGPVVAAGPVAAI